MATTQRRTYKIRMTIEVDEPIWSEEYGYSDSKTVEDYILNQLVQSTAAEAGAFKVTGYAFNGSRS